MKGFRELGFWFCQSSVFLPLSSNAMSLPWTSKYYVTTNVLFTLSLHDFVCYCYGTQVSTKSYLRSVVLAHEHEPLRQKLLSLSASLSSVSSKSPQLQLPITFLNSPVFAQGLSHGVVKYRYFTTPWAESSNSCSTIIIITCRSVLLPSWKYQKVPTSFMKLVMYSFVSTCTGTCTYLF